MKTCSFSLLCVIQLIALTQIAVCATDAALPTTTYINILQ